MMSETNLPPGISRTKLDLNSRSCDFGGMIRRTPEALSRPKSVEDVSSIVRWAARNQVSLAIRGGGHSQGGQSLVEDGLVIDIMYLNRFEKLEQDLIRVQGGSLWGKIISRLEGSDRLPPVLVDVAEVAVGGTLSAGGLGTNSHRFGLQTSHVEQLEVITGTGERVLCSSKHNAGLFDAVRGGQGQFGIITDAWIRLRSCGKYLRQYQLSYLDFERFASDFENIVMEDRFDHARAEIKIHDHEIIMGVGAEHDGELDDSVALEGLGYDTVVRIHDTTEVGFAAMYPRWAFSRRMYHPWRDWFLPWKALRAVIAQPWLDPRWVPHFPDIFIGIYPIKSSPSDAPLVMQPEGERMFSYSILSVFDTFEKAKVMAGRLREVDRTLVELGGKAYLSGAVGYGRKEWKAHFGDQFDQGVEWKNEFDPNRIFGYGGIPFRG